MNRSRNLPLYLAVKRDLVAQLERGVWLAGAALPGERTLSEQFQVSIGTLRRAVDELVQENVLLRRQGKGTFVTTHTPDRFVFQFLRIKPRDDWPLLESEAGQTGEYPKIELLEFVRAKADHECAAALRIPVGANTFHILNRVTLGARPVALDLIQICGTRFKGLTEKRFAQRESTIYKLYQTDFGVSVLSTLERVRARAPTREISARLGVPLNQPLLEVDRIAVTYGRKPVEYRVSTISTAHHDYSADTSLL